MHPIIDLIFKPLALNQVHGGTPAPSQDIQKLLLMLLVQKNLLEMTIPEKPSNRLQQYQITPKGLEHLQKLESKK